MPKSVMPSVGRFIIIKVTFFSASGSYETNFVTKSHPCEVYNKNYKRHRSHIFHVRS